LATPKTLSELTREAGIVESGVRTHLKKLEEHGLVAASISALGPIYLQTGDLDGAAVCRVEAKVMNAAVARPRGIGNLGYRDGVMPAPADWPRPRSPRARAKRTATWTFSAANTTGVSWASDGAGWVPKRIACLVVGRWHVFAYARLQSQDHSYRVDDSFLRIANEHRPTGDKPNLVWIRQSVHTLKWLPDPDAQPASFPDGWLDDAKTSSNKADLVFGSIDHSARLKREAVAGQLVSAFGAVETFRGNLTAEVARGGGDALILRDHLRRFLGSFQLPDGPLVLMGEQYRSAAVRALKAHAVHLEEPEAPDGPCLPGRLVTSPARKFLLPRRTV
jgi:hypothetical protein